MVLNLTNNDWAPQWSKFHGLFSLLNAVILKISPEMGCKSWGLEFENPTVRDYACHGLVGNLAGHASLVAGPLLTGWSTLESIEWYVTSIATVIASMLLLCYQRCGQDR